MNNSIAVFLINDNARAIEATYEDDVDGKPHPNRTTFKTFDKDLKVGDFVIVPTNTRHNMTVVKVVATDVEVNFDSTARMDWVLGKVDRAYVDNLMVQEAEAIKLIQAAEKNKKRKELQKALLENAENVLESPIALIGKPTSLPPGAPAPAI